MFDRLIKLIETLKIQKDCKIICVICGIEFFLSQVTPQVYKMIEGFLDLHDLINIISHYICSFPLLRLKQNLAVCNQRSCSSRFSPYHLPTYCCSIAVTIFARSFFHPFWSLLLILDGGTRAWKKKHRCIMHTLVVTRV